jgi:uncharacterized protein YpmB
MRFIIILLIIILIIIVGLSVIVRSLVKIFQVFSNQSEKVGKVNKRDDVIYDKNDVVILKGEAGAESDSNRKSKGTKK